MALCLWPSFIAGGLLFSCWCAADVPAALRSRFVKMADFTKGWTAEGDLLSGGHTVAPVAPSRQFSGIGAISITPPETEPRLWLRTLGLDGLMPQKLTSAV